MEAVEVELLAPNCLLDDPREEAVGEVAGVTLAGVAVVLPKEKEVPVQVLEPSPTVKPADSAVLPLPSRRIRTSLEFAGTFTSHTTEFALVLLKTMMAA